MRRAFDHGLERYRSAAGAAARSAIARGREGFWRLPAQGSSFRDFRHHGDGLFLLSRAGQHPIGGDRAVVFRGHRTACTGIFRRPVLAPRDRAGRHGGHTGRHRRVELYAVSSELFGRQCRRPLAAAARSVRHRSIASASPVRRRFTTASARRSVVALA